MKKPTLEERLRSIHVGRVVTRCALCKNEKAMKVLSETIEAVRADPTRYAFVALEDIVKLVREDAGFEGSASAVLNHLKRHTSSLWERWCEARAL